MKGVDILFVPNSVEHREDTHTSPDPLTHNFNVHSDSLAVEFHNPIHLTEPHLPLHSVTESFVPPNYMQHAPVSPHTHSHPDMFVQPGSPNSFGTVAGPSSFPPQGSHSYPYTGDLLRLHSYRPSKPTQLPLSCQTITTPLVDSEWERALADHPDRQFVDYILQGIREGFRIGFDHSRASCKSTGGNMQSALENPGPVDEYLSKEISSLRTVEVPMAWENHIHTSRFGVIPKPNQPNKFRLILDLSSPEGSSVNDGVDPLLCSMKYTSVDAAVDRILMLGKGALLAKVDVESAYRNVPVHRQDRHLLGMRWRKKLYVDTVLPFGLRSAPKIFSSLADALEWILLNRGVSTVLHYLDDFLTMGRADSTQCKENLEIMLAICKVLGVPLKAEKIEGPSAILIFLGIILDTIRQEIRLPEEKVRQLKLLLADWLK